MKKGVVPKILAKQNKDGYWEEPEKFYTAKYKGTVWQLIILAELGADGNDERIRKACEFILSRSQDLGSGGFSLWTSVRAGCVKWEVPPYEDKGCLQVPGEDRSRGGYRCSRRRP